MQDYFLQSLQVKGEVSNCKYHSSGHIYFTLKDEKASVACVMFASYRNGLKCELREGMQVVITGNADVYERDGKYQIYAKTIVQDGIGNLFERFEKLKEELRERGMFAPEYKKPIPAFTRKLGVVTAATGAAVRDIIDVSRRRNPGIDIIVCPAQVQGEGSAPSIVNAINRLDAYGVDVIIVGRGGGSIEDLWAFNEEIVAQAVFDCHTPVISAVGHETDFTIIDFVSDMRAPTPSAAAELAVCDIRAIQDQVRVMKLRLSKGMKHHLDIVGSQLSRYRDRIRMHSPIGQINEKRMRLLHLDEQMKSIMKLRITKIRHQIEINAGILQGLSPLNKLSGGYAYIENQSGRGVRSISEVNRGENLQICLKDGHFDAQVRNIYPEEN